MKQRRSAAPVLAVLHPDFAVAFGIAGARSRPMTTEFKWPGWPELPVLLLPVFGPAPASVLFLAAAEDNGRDGRPHPEDRDVADLRRSF